MRLLSRAPYICNACQRTLDVSVKRRAAFHGFQRHSSTAAPRDRPFHLAVIGSGPAGYYTAYRLMKKLPNIWVTMFEQLPVPYGLVRFGVAPDHPDVKVRAPAFVRRFDAFTDQYHNSRNRPRHWKMLANGHSSTLLAMCRLEMVHASCH